MTKTKYIRNINQLIKNTKEEDIRNGLEWYDNAFSFCTEIANKYNKDSKVVAAVLAVTSPQQAWERNKQITDEMFAVNYSRFLSQSTMNQCKKILEGQDIHTVSKGLKVLNFYESIIGNKDVVCVDTHVINLVNRGIASPEFKTKIWSSKARYNLIVDSYKHVAKKIGYSPRDLQAITWTSWKTLLDSNIALKPLK
jgi:hypothetical protein